MYMYMVGPARPLQDLYFKTDISNLIYGQQLVHIHYFGNSIIQIIWLLKGLVFTSQDSLPVFDFGISPYRFLQKFYSDAIDICDYVQRGAYNIINFIWLTFLH